MNETDLARPAAVSTLLAYPALTDVQLQRLRAYGTAESIVPGQLLYRVGEPITDLLLVDSGAIDILSAEGTDGREVFITRHTKGRFLGEMSLLSGHNSYLTARVMSPGKVHRIPPDGFRRLMAEDAEISDVILEAFRARRELVKERAARSIEILGSSGSSGSLALRTYAGRLDLPHVWFDSNSVAGLALMKTTNLDVADLPVVFLPGGAIHRATPSRVAERLGLAYRRHDEPIDLVVVGAGPAGLAAAVYGASEGLSTVLLDSVGPGGQAATSSRIENYLGFPSGLSGADLTNRAAIQALKFRAHLYSPADVTDVDSSGITPVVKISDDSEIECGAVIIATGARYRALPLARWREFEGSGIFYGATSLEVNTCAGQRVAVVGGANSAGQAALYLASHGCTVDLIVRAREVGEAMSTYLVERLLGDPRIRVITCTEVTELHGGQRLEAISVTNTITGSSHLKDCAAIFCFIGATPATSWLTGVELDEDGFVLTDVNVWSPRDGGLRSLEDAARLPFETSATSVFAAGDVRAGSMKRVAAAVGEGASAVASVHRVLAGVRRGE